MSIYYSYYTMTVYYSFYTVHMCLLCAPAGAGVPSRPPPHSTFTKESIYTRDSRLRQHCCCRGSGSTPRQATSGSAGATARRSPAARACSGGEPPQVQAGPGFIPANTCTSQQNSIHSRLLVCTMYTYSYKYEMFWHNCRVEIS